MQVMATQSMFQTCQILQCQVLFFMNSLYLNKNNVARETICTIFTKLPMKRHFKNNNYKA